VQYYFINNLLNLKNVIINKISQEYNPIKIFISTKPKEHICPACKSITSRVHDYSEQVIKDLPIHNKMFILFLKSEDMYVLLVEKDFMKLMTFFLDIIV